MPYDYARERDDALDDYDPGDVTAFDLQDEDDASERYHSPYRCADGMCGALDCSRCHPEGEGPETCTHCGETI